MELARIFAEHGHDLIVTAEDAAIGEVAERMRRHGGAAQAVQTDLSDPKGAEELDHAIGVLQRSLPAGVQTAPLKVGRGQTLTLTPRSWRQLTSGR